VKAPAFDAALDFPLGGAAGELRAVIAFVGGAAVGARLVDYAVAGRKKAPFVRVLADRLVDVKWADPFEVCTASGAVLGRGRCLYPGALVPEELKPSRRKALLARLALGEKEMILALTELGGLKGLDGEELDRFCRLSRSRVELLARTLE